MKKIKGITLTETLVAMAILGIVTTLIMMISENTFNQSSSLLQHKAENLIDQYILETETSQEFIDKAIKTDQLQLSIKFELHPNYNKIICGTYTIIELQTKEMLVKQKKLFIKK